MKQCSLKNVLLLLQLCTASQKSCFPRDLEDLKRENEKLKEMMASLEQNFDKEKRLFETKSNDIFDSVKRELNFCSYQNHNLTKQVDKLVEKSKLASMKITHAKSIKEGISQKLISFKISKVLFLEQHYRSCLYFCVPTLILQYFKNTQC